MTSESQGRPDGGRLGRVPLWVKIVVPVLVLGALVVAVVIAVNASSGSVSMSDDPEAAAEALCREAVVEEMDATGRTAGDVSQSLRVTAAGDDEYRVQGTGSYEDEDGSTKSGNVRCVVREEDGALSVASVRLDF